MGVQLKVATAEETSPAKKATIKRSEDSGRKGPEAAQSVLEETRSPFTARDGGGSSRIREKKKRRGKGGSKREEKTPFLGRTKQKQEKATFPAAGGKKKKLPRPELG